MRHKREVLAARKQLLMARASLQRLQVAHQIGGLRNRTQLPLTIVGIAFVLLRFFRKVRRNS